MLNCPPALRGSCKAGGYDVIHTRDLPQQNATPDSSINAISIQQERVVITKDSDFVDSFLTTQEPYKLLLVTTGNIRNSELEMLVAKTLNMLVALLSEHSYVELSRDTIVVHQ